MKCSDVNSPVLGLYRYLALLVKIVDSAPDVAAAKVGKTFVDVVVSFEIVAPEPVANAQTAVVPFEVSTKLFAPIGRRVALLTPLPIIKSPVLVTGDKALNAALAVV